MSNCPTCDKPLPEGAEHCPDCQFKALAAEAAPAVVPTAAPQPPEAGETPATIGRPQMPVYQRVFIGLVAYFVCLMILSRIEVRMMTSNDSAAGTLPAATPTPTTAPVASAAPASSSPTPTPTPPPGQTLHDSAGNLSWDFYSGSDGLHCAGSRTNAPGKIDYDNVVTTSPVGTFVPLFDDPYPCCVYELNGSVYLAESLDTGASWGAPTTVSQGLKLASATLASDADHRTITVEGQAVTADPSAGVNADDSEKIILQHAPGQPGWSIVSKGKG